MKEFKVLYQVNRKNYRLYFEDVYEFNSWLDTMCTQLFCYGNEIKLFRFNSGTNSYQLYKHWKRTD